jgi:hypothetical protein
MPDAFCIRRETLFYKKKNKIIKTVFMIESQIKRMRTKHVHVSEEEEEEKIARLGEEEKEYTTSQVFFFIHNISEAPQSKVALATKEFF